MPPISQTVEAGCGNAAGFGMLEDDTGHERTGQEDRVLGFLWWEWVLIASGAMVGAALFRRFFK